MERGHTVAKKRRRSGYRLAHRELRRDALGVIQRGFLSIESGTPWQDEFAEIFHARLCDAF